jgi:putative ABC transport system permease protein
MFDSVQVRWRLMSINLRLALRSLRANRMRSGLTMLGIVIGVAAVVVMISVSIGARERIAAQVRSLGANLISVHAGSASMGSVQLGRGAAARLNEHDALAMAAEITGVEIAAPLLYARAQFTMGSANWQGAIRGATPLYLAAREWRVSSGRELTDEDQRNAARVVLLGTTMQAKLFAQSPPVGSTIRIRDVPFTVIGVLERKGESVWGEDQDDVAIVPLSTARRQFVGTSRANPALVHNITVRFTNTASGGEVIAELEQLLRQRHRLGAGQEDAFLVSNLAEAAELEASATKILSLLLSAIASVSLVVGGIGIMNIMLVTVTERTREIGLRQALGARQRDILGQFLLEAVALAVVGGIFGIFLGITASITIAVLAGWPAIIDLSTLLLALGSAATVGITFGYYPARRASRRSPSEALRFA